MATKGDIPRGTFYVWAVGKRFMLLVDRMKNMEAVLRFLTALKKEEVVEK